MFKKIIFIVLAACSVAAYAGNKVVAPVKKMVMSKGDYEKVTLEKDEIVLKLIQNSVENINTPEDAERVIAANLKKIGEMITQACTEGEKPDIILLHEFPLSGYVYGTRNDKLSISLEIPGKESAMISELAQKYDTYIIFGSYAKDKDWPGHILSLTTIIGRDGEIVEKVWKPKNIKRFYSTFEITTTTVEGVKDKFREKYGVEKEFPVIRTEFGNIAVSTVQLDPFVYAAYAMKGAEIFLRTSTMFFESDVLSMSMINDVYSAMANIPGESIYAGNSMVVSPFGEVIGRLDRQNDGILTAKIPIAEFRKGRKVPQFSLEMTKDIFEQFEEEIPANHLDLPEAELPQDGKEMKKLLDDKSRWINP